MKRFQTTSAQTDTRPEAEDHIPSAHEQKIDVLVFKRDLNEAYLLMDFVSGRTDRSLEFLTMVDPTDCKTTLSSSEIVKRVTALRYPPDPDPTAKSENAAFLLIAKDHLSGLARPARALTIAYTIMFAEGGGHRFSSWFSGHGRKSRDPDPRLDLARGIFPALQRHAGLFRSIRTLLVFATIGWLLLTIFTYWQIALTRSVLQRLEYFWKERSELVQTNPELLDRKLCPNYEPGDKKFNPSNKDVEARIIPACGRLYYIDRSRHEARLDLDSLIDCEGVWPNLAANALTWVNVQCRPVGGQPTPGDYKASWQSANSVLSAFSTYVLPMMFGLLGTLIAALRSIQKLGTRQLIGTTRLSADVTWSPPGSRRRCRRRIVLQSVWRGNPWIRNFSG
ncbi:MAG: hypothetical protein ACJ73N_01015 [Bryobacteraceae bacterium]